MWSRQREAGMPARKLRRPHRWSGTRGVSERTRNLRSSRAPLLIGYSPQSVLSSLPVLRLFSVLGEPSSDDYLPVGKEVDCIASLSV